jgi:hypothetical protein
VAKDGMPGPLVFPAPSDTSHVHVGRYAGAAVMMQPTGHPQLIGWREWVALPQFGAAAMRAKIDTGARSSALHVDWLEEDPRADGMWLRFGLRPRRARREVVCAAAATDRRRVTDSGGQATDRWLIRTALLLAGLEFQIEINLTSRRTMLFPLLLGRSALQQRFQVDPARSFLCGRPSKDRP